MILNEYQFGFIVAEGKRYDHDVEIRFSGEVLPWQTKNKHIVDVEDVQRAVSAHPQTIIIGIGHDKMVTITEAALKFIQENGIRLITDRTDEAVRTYNIIDEESEDEDGVQDDVIGLFHVTC